jgi:hypothetical protein
MRTGLINESAQASLAAARPSASSLVLGIGLAQLALQASLLANGVEYVTASLTIDDTYYYLLTAWNTWHLGFVTFDGLHPTNGVQLLWFGVILALALVASSKMGLLFTTLAVSFAFNALCYWVILKIGAALKRPALAWLLAILWCLQTLPFRTYTIGMENSLHALVYWAVIWQALEFLLRAQRGQRPNIMALTAVLILNAWTRLDSALMSALVYAFCVGVLARANRFDLRAWVRRDGRAILGTSLLAGLALLAQLGAFQWMGDSFLPVSALVKTSGAGRGLGLASAQKFIEVLVLGMPSILQARLPASALPALGAVGVALVLLARWDAARRSREMRACLNLWTGLLAGELLYHAYIAVSGAQYTSYFIWYRSPSFIFWTMTGALLGLFAFEHVRARLRFGRVGQWMAAAACVLTLGWTAYLFARNVPFMSGMYRARYGAALWIAENAPADAVFAAWNTGQFAYFSERTFINLDGVINSVDYYERVLRGPVPLEAYLRENNVSYLADYAVYDTLPDFPIIHSFPIDDGTGRSIHIWQVTEPAAASR